MILKINKFIIIIIVVILIAILIINIKLVEDNESSGILNPSQEGNGVNEKKVMKNHLILIGK